MRAVVHDRHGPVGGRFETAVVLSPADVGIDSDYWDDGAIDAALDASLGREATVSLALLVMMPTMSSYSSDDSGSGGSGSDDCGSDDSGPDWSSDSGSDPGSDCGSDSGSD